MLELQGDSPSQMSYIFLQTRSLLYLVQVLDGIPDTTGLTVEWLFLLSSNKMSEGQQLSGILVTESD